MHNMGFQDFPPRMERKIVNGDEIKELDSTLAKRLSIIFKGNILFCFVLIFCLFFFLIYSYKNSTLELKSRGEKEITYSFLALYVVLQYV